VWTHCIDHSVKACTLPKTIRLCHPKYAKAQWRSNRLCTLCNAQGPPAVKGAPEGSLFFLIEGSSRGPPPKLSTRALTNLDKAATTKDSASSWSQVSTIKFSVLIVKASWFSWIPTADFLFRIDRHGHLIAGPMVLSFSRLQWSISHYEQSKTAPPQYTPILIPFIVHNYDRYLSDNFHWSSVIWSILRYVQTVNANLHPSHTPIMPLPHPNPAPLPYPAPPA